MKLEEITAGLSLSGVEPTQIVSVATKGSDQIGVEIQHTDRFLAIKEAIEFDGKQDLRTKGLEKERTR